MKNKIPFKKCKIKFPNEVVEELRKQASECENEAQNELEDFLTNWCYRNGSPFTRITFTLDSGLKIDNDDETENLYNELKKLQGTHQEYVFDDNGNLIMTKLVKNSES